MKFSAFYGTQNFMKDQWKVKNSTVQTSIINAGYLAHN
jgi:hypothetical protein